MSLIGALLVVLAGVLAVLDLADLAKFAEMISLAVLSLTIGVLLLHGPAVWRR